MAERQKNPFRNGIIQGWHIEAFLSIPIATVCSWHTTTVLFSQEEDQRYTGNITQRASSLSYSCPCCAVVTSSIESSLVGETNHPSV